MSETKIMLGNAAIARGAYEAGVKVASAYPGTPSTEVSENLVQYKDALYCEWAPNEKVATEVAIGASISGVRAMCCMKHVGVNVAADPLYSISYAGVGGGLVMVAADDPGLYSSQNEQDTRCVARAAQVPVLEPSDSQEAKDFTKLAFELREKYDSPHDHQTGPFPGTGSSGGAHRESTPGIHQKCGEVCPDAGQCQGTPCICGRAHEEDGGGCLFDGH